MLLAATLLENDAQEAKKVLAGPPLRYDSKEDYFKAVAAFDTDRDLVRYTDTGAEILF